MKQRTITCGKCGKKSPAGAGHNVRTCGKNSPPVRETSAPSNVLNRTRSSSVSQSEALTLADIDVNNLPNTAMRDRELVVYGVKDVAVEEGTGRLKLILDMYLAEYRFLTEEESANFNHIKINGAVCYFNEEGLLHRDGYPAVKRGVHGYEWWVNGKLHNETGPAKKKMDGTLLWYRKGELHRENGPAIEWWGGDREWHFHGKASGYPNVCEKAIRPDLTDSEFYELCTHEDYVVRQLAALHPNCPEEFKIIVELYN